jgi:hypothetical protein
MEIPAHELTAGLELAKRGVNRLAWAYSLHLPCGLGGGGAAEVIREGENIIAWIDHAIDKIERERIAKAV